MSRPRSPLRPLVLYAATAAMVAAQTAGPANDTTGHTSDASRYYEGSVTSLGPAPLRETPEYGSARVASVSDGTSVRIVCRYSDRHTDWYLLTHGQASWAQGEHVQVRGHAPERC